MKKQINFWLVTFFAILLTLPIYSAAQTAAPPALKLTLESSSGDRIGGATVKAFSLGPDNNLVVYLDGPFTTAALLPDIKLEYPPAPTVPNCTITPPASVAGAPNSTISFVARSSNIAAVISLIVDPLQTPPRTLTSTNGSATFDWNTTNFPPGSYLAVFQAAVGSDISQLVVMINIGYTVTASYDSTKGSVSPASQTVSSGGTATFTVTPNPGYAASVSEGSLSGTTWTIPNVTTSHTATVTFNPIPVTVTASFNSTMGSVLPPSQTVNYGATATFTVTPNPGYNASVSEGSLSGTSWTIPNVTTTHTATVTFNPIPVTVTASFNSTMGSVLPPNQTVNYGATATFTVTPNLGYNASVSEGSLSGTTWTILNVTTSHTATVTFSTAPVQTYSITLYVSGSGTVTKNPDKALYNSGESVTLAATATPGTGATFVNWTGDLTGTTTPVTITMSADKLITANFSTGGGGGGGGGGTVYTKLYNIAPGSGDFYGLGYDSYADGQTKRYTLPLGEVYPGKDISRLLVKTAATIDGRGDVSMRLISPDGRSYDRISDGSFADETLNAIGTSYPMGTNYPALYLDNGNWTLEITAKVASDIKIWWKCY